jgi:hypothetical protein
MSARFITYVIIGVAFGCTQLWFVYWVVKLYKERQRILAARRAGRSTASGQAASGLPAPEAPKQATPGRAAPASPHPDTGSKAGRAGTAARHS